MQTIDERIQAFAESDPQAYIALRGPIDQDLRSVWEGQSNLYEEMRNVVLANGYNSVTEFLADVKAHPRVASGML